MALVTRAGKGSKLNSNEMDSNLTYLATTLSGSIIQVTGSTIQAPNTSITGSFFVGDGSKLTNITASSIAPGNVSAAGSNTYIQYNNSGILGAEAAFTYNASTNTLTVTNVVATDIQVDKALDTTNGYLIDGSSLTAVDWKNRALKYTGGATAVDWTTDNRLILSSSQMSMKGLANTNQTNLVSIDTSTGRLYYMSTSSLSTLTASLVTTASATNNTITFTKGNGSTFAVTLDTGSGGGAFPFSGNAIITGSLFIAQSGSNHLGIPGIGIISNQGSIYVYDNPALTQYRTIRVEDAGGYGSTIMSLDQLSINNTNGNLELLLSGSYTNAGYEDRTMLKHTSNIGADLYITSNTKIRLSGSSGTIINGSLSQGFNLTSSGLHSHAEGYNNIASGNGSHAEGRFTTASGTFSHTEGNYTIALGNYSHAEGYSTSASGNWSHAEGQYTIASNQYSHAEGFVTIAAGDSSHAEGSYTSASGGYSHAEGYLTISKGTFSHAEGYGSTSSGSYSHAEGDNTLTKGLASHAEGLATIAQGNSSHAEGQQTIALGNQSHAEGYSTTSSGLYSHAEGESTQTIGQASHAGGLGTVAEANYQTVVGHYNDYSGNTSPFVVGYGADNANRANAFEVTSNSSIIVATQSAAPGWTGKEGEIVPVQNGGSSYYIYVYIGGQWRSSSLS